MDLEDAKEILEACDRIEASDPIFGGHCVDVTWVLCGAKIADGHFSPEHSSVFLTNWVNPHHFKGLDAKALRHCGGLISMTGIDCIDQLIIKKGDCDAFQ